MSYFIIYPTEFQPCRLPVEDGYEIYQSDLDAIRRHPDYSEEVLRETLRSYILPVINKIMCSRLVPGYDLADALKPYRRDIESFGDVPGRARVSIDFPISAVDFMNVSHAADHLNVPIIVLIRTAFSVRCQRPKPVSLPSTPSKKNQN